ncbi:hypothetical protein C8Q75DRAFT_336400 [Abortiporus biennis]|nr:hypothetical protein C8Q75DRAFT_336400 [Abortiporus biennis]
MPQKHTSNILASSRQHPAYWLDDGTLIVHVGDSAFKVYDTLLQQSTVLASLPRWTEQDVPAIQIPDHLAVQRADFEALLDHLYNKTPIGDHTPFPRVAAVLRISSERQLNIPAINATARKRLMELYPQSLDDITMHIDHADLALDLAVQYNVAPILRGLYYQVATGSHLDDDDGGVEEAQMNALAHLPQEVSQRCTTLLDELIAHFTPILFTVATANHMACTDVFAELWMPLVIQPAIENNGLSKPIETLQAIIDMDWSSHGLCEECVQDKREEWKEEQRVVWNKLGDWIVE